MPGSGSEAASYGDLLVMSLVVLGGVCVAAFVAVRLLGRFLATGRTRGAHLLDVVARVPLEPRRSLYVVDVAGKTLLVGTSEMGLSVLSELDRAEVRARVVERPTFAELVRTAWAKRRGTSRSEPADGAATSGSAASAALDDAPADRSAAASADAADSLARTSPTTTSDSSPVGALAVRPASSSDATSVTSATPTEPSGKTP